jgi:endoribonuclease Dicer
MEPADRESPSDQEDAPTYDTGGNVRPSGSSSGIINPSISNMMRRNPTRTDQDSHASLSSYSNGTLKLGPSQPSAVPSNPSSTQSAKSQDAANDVLGTLTTELRIDSAHGGETDGATLDAEQDLNHSDDDQPGGASKPGQSTVRRMVQQNQFDQWLRKTHMRLTDASSESLDDGSDASIPSSDLVKDPSQKRIISTPREYQVELFERAKEKNLIVVLPTGTGKTLIAALLIRHTVEQELIERSAKDPSLEPRTTFFLVDKVSLVHQQWKVLNSNLSHNVARFHGQIGGAMATPGFWKGQLESNMVIVCTAEILRKCLSHGYLRMNQINLLVFDEAHHAKKNHPYSRIIKDFYVELEEANVRRPRILGMTASPVDGKDRLSVTAAQLEGLLHSEIATVDDPALMRPDEVGAALDQVIEYSLSTNTWETPLWTRLKGLLGENRVFRRLFIFARASTKELGMWGADRVWHLCLTAEEVLKAQATTERSLLMGHEEVPPSVIDEQKGAIEEAYQAVLRHMESFPPADLSAGHLSHKIAVLVGILKQHFRPAFDKCIIFVEQRLMATILADLLRQPGLDLPGIEPGVLVSAKQSN